MVKQNKILLTSDNLVNCTYCDLLFVPTKFNVCEKCLNEIVIPLKKRGRGIKNTPFKEYKKEVWRLTELNSKKIDGIEKRGWTNEHIDHKYSIFQVFKDGKSVEWIASLENLRMLNYKENMIKGVKCI